LFTMWLVGIYPLMTRFVAGNDKEAIIRGAQGES
jgi:hypothetical protein